MTGNMLHWMQGKVGRLIFQPNETTFQIITFKLNKVKTLEFSNTKYYCVHVVVI